MTSAGRWVRDAVVGRFLNRGPRLMWALAYAWRRILWRTTFVAVTGSLGKTTAKECMATCLRARFPTARSRGNQNSGAWLALNILRVRPWHRYAVLEVSAGVRGQIARAARLVRPDVAVVLSIARTHTNEYPSLAANAAEKAELLAALRPGGLAVLNADDPRVAAMRPPAGCDVIWFGTCARAGIRGRVIEQRWPARLSLQVERGSETATARTQLVGAHWTPAVLAALAVAGRAGVPLAAAAEALGRVSPFPGRFQPVRLPNGAVILRDDYNGAVDTLDAAVRVLAEAVAERRILLVSDVSDSGEHRPQRLRLLARVAAASAELALFVGEEAAYGRRRAIAAGLAPDRVHAFATLAAATEFLRGELRAGDLLLLKGRTSDHTARVFHALLGPIRCWKPTCPRRILCDDCWELGVGAASARGATLVPAPLATPFAR